MSLLRESLRHARHIVSDPTGDLSARNIQAALDEIAAEKINQSQKAQANGVATLDASGKVPTVQLPAASLETAQSILTKLKTVDGSGSGLDADLLDGKTSADFVLVVNISSATNDSSTTKVSAAAATKKTWDHAQAAHNLIGSKDTEYKSTFEKIANRNKVNGYAGLDSAGKLSPNAIPGQTIVNVEVYASTAERNADTSLHKGDMAIIEASGSASLYILKKDPAGKATTDADWLTLQTNVTVDVRSWNGRNGNVMPALGDYTSALILHDGSALDGVLEGIENSIPTTPGELNAYSKTEADGRFINKTSISNATNSTSPTTVGSSQAVKSAYDRGTSALNTANGKIDKATADTLYLAKTAKAADSDKLDGKDSTAFILTTAISSAVNSTSTTTVGSSQAVKTAYDKGNAAYNGLNNKLDKTAKAADSAKLEGQNGAFYSNSSNQNAGTLPAARLPRYRVVTANTTLSHGDKALVDMTGGNVTVNLPASPAAGMCVSVMDAAALADAKSLTVARNSQPIMGLMEDVVFDVPGYKADFVYLNSSRGWVVA